MDRLLRMDREQFIARMLADVRRALGEVADAVNDAPDGAVLGGSEMRVRDVMGELRRKAFETAVQMRIDSTESSFSPSGGAGRHAQAEQGAVDPEHADGQRPGRRGPGPVVRPGRGQ